MLDRACRAFNSGKQRLALGLLVAGSQPTQRLTFAAGKGKLRPLGPVVSCAGCGGRQPAEYAPSNPLIGTSRLAAGSAYRFRQTPHHHRLYAQFVHFDERGQPVGTEGTRHRHPIRREGAQVASVRGEHIDRAVAHRLFPAALDPYVTLPACAQPAMFTRNCAGFSGSRGSAPASPAV